MSHINRSMAIKELAILAERVEFLQAVIASTKPKHKPSPYGCQQYDATRPCRFDRRALDRKCDGCERVTDRDYLESNGLWVHGVAYEVTK